MGLLERIEEGEGGLRTLSPSPAIRLAYFITAMVLYDLWQGVNPMLMAREPSMQRRPRKDTGS
jgi:hypothetical protein